MKCPGWRVIEHHGSYRGLVISVSYLEVANPWGGRVVYRRVVPKAWVGNVTVTLGLSDPTP